jgi:PAS domain S-box-containing protein
VAVVATLLAAIVGLALTPVLGARAPLIITLSLSIGVATTLGVLSARLHRGRLREQAARQKAELGLRKALQVANGIDAERERVSAVVSGVPGVVWEAWGPPDDASQRFGFVSQYAETMLGYTVADWLGTPNFWLSIVHPDDRVRVAADAATAFERGESSTNQFRWLAKEGRVVWVEAHATVMRDASGRPSGMRGVTFDITSRRDAERAVRQSVDDLTRMQATERLSHDVRALLASIVDSSEDAIVSKSLDGTITSWNAGAERIFGYTAPEAVGQDISLIIPRDRLDEEKEILHRLREGQVIKHIETERMTKDGRRINISLTVSPVRAGDGSIVGASKVSRDITDRVQADRERKRLLASEQAARAQAEAASRAKDEFLATVSHELRTPLNAILGWAAMFERMTPADDRTAKAVQSISRNTRALTQVVDDLLDVSRMIAGKLRLDVASVDLGDVVDASVEAVLPAATVKNIEIDVSISPAARTVIGDAARLQQTMWNLLSNAIKFTPARGRVVVTTRSVNGDVELTVRDTGVGIEPAFLPYMFDRFRQADSSSTRAHSGLGLGLAIVRHLVELHGGTVRADSDGRDTGTRITLRLPRKFGPFDEHVSRARQAPVSATSDVPQDLPRLNGVRVLIVDDDRESCEVMRETLSECGAHVRCATSAAEGLDALTKQPPDLVLSDIAMPGRDGYAVLNDVRALEPTLGRRVPVAAVSAYARPEDRTRAIASGFDEYLSKPVEPARLARVVATLVIAADR